MHSGRNKFQIPLSIFNFSTLHIIFKNLTLVKCMNTTSLVNASEIRGWISFFKVTFQTNFCIPSTLVCFSSSNDSMYFQTETENTLLSSRNWMTICKILRTHKKMCETRSPDNLLFPDRNQSFRLSLPTVIARRPYMLPSSFILKPWCR